LFLSKWRQESGACGDNAVFCPQAIEECLHPHVSVLQLKCFRAERIWTAMGTLQIGRCVRRILLLLSIPAPVFAQLPFYTDEPAVMDKGEFDFEFSNQYDILQLQYPRFKSPSPRKP